jgi:integrase
LWEGCRRLLDSPRLTAHGLRHSFATAALEARVPVEVVAARLGNTAWMVQEVYQHHIPAEEEAAVSLVGDLCRTAGGSWSVSLVTGL